ncbi:MAG: two-component regulator propeller domain-containing protein [Bacteroidota bacterium]
MKYIHVGALFLMSVLHTSCVQNQTNVPKDNIKSETKDTVTSGWPANHIVHKIRKGSKGTILIVSRRGVFRYDARLPGGQEKSFTNLTSKLGSHRFNDALEDRKGDLWFATDDSAGVYYYNGKSFQHFTTREGLANNRVICIYEDKAGIIWFGTEGGLSRYDGKSFQNFSMKGEYWWSNFITTIMEDKAGKLWIATRGDVSIYDGKTFYTVTNKDNAFDVWSIIEDKKGNIWFGGWDGLRRYDGKTFTKFAHNTGYNFIIEDKKGNIWTSGIIKGSTWALSRYDQKSLYDKEPTVTEIMSGQLRTSSGILEANDGSIWFGNANGVYRYDGKAITDFKSKEDRK